MERASKSSNGLERFKQKYPGFPIDDASGATRIDIDTSYVNPAFNPSDVPDYRTEHEVINAGAEAWKDTVEDIESSMSEAVAEEPVFETVSETTREVSAESLPSGVDSHTLHYEALVNHPTYGPVLEGVALKYLQKTDFFTQEDLSDQLDEEGFLIRRDGSAYNRKPSMCFSGPEMIAIREETLRQLEEISKSPENGVVTKETQIDEDTEVPEKLTVKKDSIDEESTVTDSSTDLDSEEIDHIITRMRGGTANLNHSPVRNTESVIASEEAKKEEAENIEKQSETRVFVGEYITSLRKAFSEINPEEYVGKGLSETQVADFQHAFDTAEETLVALESMLVNETEPSMKLYQEKIFEHQSARVALDEIRSEYKDKSKDSDIEFTPELIESEINSLNTDLQLLAKNIDAWKADLLNRKSYRAVEKDIRARLAAHKDGTEKITSEMVEQRMQRLRDLHESIFEFEMKQNNIVDETGEVNVLPDEVLNVESESEPESILEEAPNPFEESDEPEFKFEDNPVVLREPLLQPTTQNQPTERAPSDTEVSQEANQLMMQELRRRGLEDEWEKGKFFGLSRPLSEMRFDEFRDNKTQYGMWLSDLIQQAGKFAPREEISMRMRMSEYLQLVFEGIVKTKRRTT